MQDQSNEKVETLSTAPSINTQFGKGMVYANSRKYPAWVTISGSLLCLVLVVPMFVSGPPSKEEVQGIDAPELDNSGSKDMKIPFFSAEEAQAEKERKKHKRPVIIQKYIGLQSIDPDFNMEIPAGLEVLAKLLTASTDGPVQVELLEDLQDDGKVYLKAGAILKGTAFSNDNRLEMNFQTVKILNRKLSIQAQALDPDDKSIGIGGSKWAYYSKRFGMAIGFSMVSGMTDVLQEREAVGEQAVKKSNLSNAALNGINQATNQLSQEEMDRVKKSANLIKLKPGTKIIVSFL